MVTLHNALNAVEEAGVEVPVFLDVGANLGCFSLTFAALGFDVIAFEGMPRNQLAMYSSLCETPALLERVTLFPFALGDANAECSILSDDINVGDGHVVCDDDLRDAMLGRDYRERSRTRIVRLGDYLAGTRVDVMKMDVEGFEPRVIAGAGAHSPSFAACLPLYQPASMRPP